MLSLSLSLFLAVSLRIREDFPSMSNESFSLRGNATSSFVSDTDRRTSVVDVDVDGFRLGAVTASARRRTNWDILINHKVPSVRVWAVEFIINLFIYLRVQVLTLGDDAAADDDNRMMMMFEDDDNRMMFEDCVDFVNFVQT